MAKKLVVKGEPKEVTAIRNKILAEFKDLTFIEEGHKYFLNGMQLPSVSEVTHQFCAYPFDEQAQAIAYAERHGKTPQHWLDEWKFKNLRATTTGTLVHAYGESLGWLKSGHPELITEDNKCKYIKDKNWLIPTRPKEEAILKFYDELHPNLHFVLAETKVYSNKSKSSEVERPFCGTFDLLMYYENTMISVVLLKNLYYSSFLLPKTILIFGLFRIFVLAGESPLNQPLKPLVLNGNDI